MKKEINPLAVAIALALIVGVLGYFGYQRVASPQVDSVQDMSPELKAKMNAAYGGQPKAPTGSTR